jgi:hypothetical protein
LVRAGLAGPLRSRPAWLSRLGPPSLIGRSLPNREVLPECGRSHPKSTSLWSAGPRAWVIMINAYKTMGWYRQAGACPLRAPAPARITQGGAPPGHKRGHRIRMAARGRGYGQHWAVATGSPHPKARGKGQLARLRGASVWVLALLVGPGSRMASLQPRQTARPRPECRPRPWHVHALQQWAWPSPGAPAAACAGCCWCRGGAASRARGLAARRGTGSNCAHRGAWRKDGPGECVPRLLPY